jgi:hypothetical protein
MEAAMATAKSSKSVGDARRVRMSNPTSAARAPLSATADVKREDRDGTLMSPSERQRLLRSEFQQEALPSAPDIPGFHTCWLSTTSSYDPIHKRMRMGYSPVKAEEVPGLESFRMKSGEMEGNISCNEMVLFKIPTELYLEIMNEFHHNMPMSEEASIKANLRGSQVDSKGKPLIDDDDIEGFEDLAVRRPANFAL